MGRKSSGSVAARKGKARIDRRTFLGSLGSTGAAMALGTSGLTFTESTLTTETSGVGSPSPSVRRAEALNVRRNAAALAFRRPMPDQTPNGEEADYPHIANFIK